MSYEKYILLRTEKNADPTRTHLNRRLIGYPDGVKDRSAAVQRRLEEAGLTRKIGSNQVRAIRINVSGTHEDMKRYRKKPTDTVRLCADDIITRLKLKSCQNIYAEAMAKYGLQRGIDGSKARHKSTQQYYRDIQKLADDLKAEVVDLQQQKETAREELRRAKKETQTEKLKGAATIAAANIAESVGSLFGSNQVQTLERKNTALHREIADHEETIEVLQDRIHTMQAEHTPTYTTAKEKQGIQAINVKSCPICRKSAVRRLWCTALFLYLFARTQFFVLN